MVKCLKWLILVFKLEQKIGKVVKNIDFMILIEMEPFDYTL